MLRAWFFAVLTYICRVDVGQLRRSRRIAIGALEEIAAQYPEARGHALAALDAARMMGDEGNHAG